MKPVKSQPPKLPITYRIALGKYRGQKALTLRTTPTLSNPKPFLSSYSGFSLHAGTFCPAHDRKKLERLCRYISRPSLSEARFSLNNKGQVVYKLKTPYRNGTTHIVLDPLDFLSRLASLVPRPRIYKIQAAAKGISGDFFDIIPLQDPMKFGILLSSCNNYALTTLFLSSLLKSSGPLREQQTAKDFLCHLSDEIFSSLSKKEPVHIFYGIVNRRDFTLDYCVAGHVFAGLRSSNQPVTILPVCSKTVHKNNKNLFVSHTTTLQSGDALVICSPGVLDRVNKQGKTFGSSAIAGILNNNPFSGALEIRQKILFYADEFANRKWTAPYMLDRSLGDPISSFFFNLTSNSWGVK